MHKKQVIRLEKFLFRKFYLNKINYVFSVSQKGSNYMINKCIKYDAKTVIQKVVLNAIENEGEGNVVCALAKKNNAITFNYMNGTKARDPTECRDLF